MSTTIHKIAPSVAQAALEWAQAKIAGMHLQKTLANPQTLPPRCERIIREQQVLATKAGKAAKIK